ncbi:MAG: hypothetical protein P8M78_03050 [Myxococcota bacterium]|nr:hypothetical protein [Myxococcota bacterium]
MNFNKTHGIGLLALSVALGMVLSSTAQAQVFNKFSLTGNSRSQIGDGLPLPITFAPAPNGAVPIKLGATVQQEQGPDPKAMKIIGTPSPNFSTNFKNQPVFALNKAVAQVRTSLIINGPWAGTGVVGTRTFEAGGRTGPATFDWCPGLALPLTADPGCGNPLTDTRVTDPKGKVRYQATGNQFGGSFEALVGGAGSKGGASVVLMLPGGFAGVGVGCAHPAVGPPNAGQNAVTSCVGIFSPIAVDTHAVAGRPIGAPATNFPAPAPNNIRPMAITANGNVTRVFGPTGAPTGPVNNVEASWGFPYTTGIVSVKASDALGSAEQFILSGSDNRVDGIGSISMVSGGLSDRTLSGSNANRAWLNWTIPGGTPAPSISNGGLVLLSALMLGATLWMLRRATRTA